MVMGKKTKFVNVDSKGGQVPLLPGRERCECQAVKHPLVNNCLSCGRIVCLQEGSGPCFFCGEVVMNKDEREKVRNSGDSKDAQNVIKKYNRMTTKLQEQKRGKEAEEQKQKLLEFDRDNVKRTQVIDDQSDYFAAESPWLSKEQKKAIEDKKQEYLDAKNRLKRPVKVTIDFSGRRVIEEVSKVSMADFALPAENSHSARQKPVQNYSDENDYQRLIEPKFVGSLEKTHFNPPSVWSSRLQDSELQEMVDSGSCLSVNQPYTSMIMEGVKLFEGRSWYTPFRGRLWIHAGRKPPTPELLDQVLNIYKHIVGDIKFPENFPLGCLLGCVDLVDCIPQEEYLQLYPTGEVADPYVFVLANPQILPVKLPMNGKLKIFKLEEPVHHAARKALEKQVTNK